MNHIELGQKGEEVAVNHLSTKGYVVIERNYKWKSSEVDIICKKDNLLVVVEVKTRNSMALYYYTFDETARLRTTNYRARPTDGKRRALIWLDKTAIGLYTRVKRRLNIPDEVVGRILGKLRRK